MRLRAQGSELVRALRNGGKPALDKPPSSQRSATRCVCASSHGSAKRGPCRSRASPEGTDVSRQGITKHLNVLAKAGVVLSVHVGRETVWELEPRRLIHARELLDVSSDDWDERIGRLRALVERSECKERSG